MIRLLENPVLLEHGEFTDLIWALFHLEEELSARGALDQAPAADLRHLAQDVDRALRRLLVQWLEHLIHLRQDYPSSSPLRRERTPCEREPKRKYQANNDAKALTDYVRTVIME